MWKWYTSQENSQWKRMTDLLEAENFIVSNNGWGGCDSFDAYLEYLDRVEKE